MAHLFTPYALKGLQLKNRIVMAPMCQYSVTAKDGKPNDWHFVHYTSRAVGGVGLILMEMTDVHPDGRITDLDLGIWSDDHIPSFARVIDACHAEGARIGIQIAHAGRKAEDAATPVAPSAVRFPVQGYKTPHALSADEIKQAIEQFAAGARRAVKAGADTVELHAAHGYLLHQFQSPVTNRREDGYGHDLARFGVEVIQAVRAQLPADMPLLMRVSAIEYVDGGYGLEHMLDLARRYRDAGVDLFDVSSGGEGPAGSRRPGNFPGYQVPFARTIKHTLGVPVMAVGKLEQASLAEATVGNGDADLIALARGLLRNPYWAYQAATELQTAPAVVQQYQRAF